MKALENGYENLDIQVVTSAAGSKYAKVTLAYRYTIPLLNMLLEHQITGICKNRKNGERRVCQERMRHAVMGFLFNYADFAGCIDLYGGDK